MTEKALTLNPHHLSSQWDPFSLQNKLLSGCFGIFADLVWQFLCFAGSHSCFTACSNLQQCWFKTFKHSKHCKCCGCLSRFENEHQRALSPPHLSPGFANYADVSFFENAVFRSMAGGWLRASENKALVLPNWEEVVRWFSSEKILIKLSASPYCVAKELRDITDGFF